MFVNFSALVIAGVVVFAAIGHVWLFADVTSSSPEYPTEDPQH